MKLSYSLLTFISVLPSLVFSTPLPDPVPGPLPSKICSDVVLIIDLLKLNKATPFCSSFLHISTSTVLQTVTVASVATETFTQTSSAELTLVTGTSTEVDYETTTTGTETSYTTTDIASDTITGSTTTVTPTVNVVSYITATTPPAKRRRLAHDDEIAGRGIHIPPFVAAFASTAISDACSCLDLPTPTVTSVVTATTPTTTPVSTTITNTQTFLTSTVTTTLSIIPTDTVDLAASTSTDSITVTYTSTAPAATVTTTKTLYCGICAAETENYEIGGQDGCSGLAYSKQACDAYAGSCFSFAYGLENRGTYSEPVCYIYTADALTVAASAGEGSGCPFKYYDAGCSV